MIFRKPDLVRLGVQNLAADGTEPTLVQVKIKKVIKHPEYNSIQKDHDIALLELEESVKFDAKLLRPACLQQDENPEANLTAV